MGKHVLENAVTSRGAKKAHLIKYNPILFGLVCTCASLWIALWTTHIQNTRAFTSGSHGGQQPRPDGACADRRGKLTVALLPYNHNGNNRFIEGKETAASPEFAQSISKDNSQSPEVCILTG